MVKREILKEKEKERLRKIIKSLNVDDDYIDFIVKKSILPAYEELQIGHIEGNIAHILYYRGFLENSEFMHMEPNKQYTLEELGL